MASTYVTKQGDTWDLIAKKVYGAEKYLDHLMASLEKLRGLNL